MELKKLFDFTDSLIGDISEYLGLAFRLDHGILIIDFVKDFDFEGDIVDGFIIDFVPFDGEQQTYFSLDEEGVKEIISEFVLE